MAKTNDQRAFATAVLDVDSSWTLLAMKGVDAEHLDTRRFQIEEICQIRRISYAAVSAP